MLSTKVIGLLVSLPLLFVSCNASAKDLKVNIQLVSINAIKLSESRGDELYLSITEYPIKLQPKMFRVPSFPLNWASKSLPEIKNINVWQGSLKDNESTLVIISLMEQDIEPFNVDDHIGSVQVKLVNKNGRLDALWGQPSFVDQPKVTQPDVKIPKFMLFGEDSQYVTLFKVQAK